MPHKRIISFITFLVLYGHLQAQLLTPVFHTNTHPYTTRIISAKDGLPSPEILALTQDSRGFVWIGTSLGLARYDGISFEHFLTCGGIQLGKTHNIIDDTLQGVIWVMSDAGLGFYRNGMLHPVVFENGYTGIYDISTDKKGNYWMATGKGPACYTFADFVQLIDLRKGSLEKHLFPLWGISAERKGPVKKIAAISETDVWFSARNTLYHYDGKDIHKIWQAAALNDGIISIVPLASNKVYFVSGLSGVYEYTGKEINPVYTKPTISANLFPADSSIYYLNQQGIYRLNPDDNSLWRISTVQEDQNKWLSRIMVDREQNLWIGMHHALLFQQKKIFSEVTGPANIVHSGFFSCFKQKSGNLIFGGTQGSIYKRNHGRFLNTNIQLPTSADITAIYEDMRGWIWYATGYDGIFVDNKKEVRHLTEKDGLGAAENFFFKEDSMGNIWTGGDGAITKIVVCESNNSIHCRGYSGRLSGDNWFTFLNFVIGPDATNWFAGAKGIFTFRNDTLQFYQIPGVVSQPNISGIIMDAHQEVWLSTKGEGIWHCYFNGEGKLLLKRKLRMEQGLNSNIYLDLAADEQNTIWAVSYSGISHISRDASSYTVNNYNTAHGLPGNNYQHAKLLAENDHTMWIVTSSGLTHFDPAACRAPVYRPLLVLSGIQTKDSTYFYNSPPKESNTAIPELPYHNNNISFHFSGIYYSNPAAVKYYYRLSGTDTGWTDAGNKQVISFQRLAPGKYTLEAKAVLGSSSISPPVIYRFSINSPFWLKWWFLLLCFLAALFLSVYAIKHRERTIRKKTAEKNAVQQQIAELEIKALRSQMNPHFVFNSLNSIAQLIASNQNEKGLDYLSRFSKLMRMVLDEADNNFIVLKDEIQILTLYLQLESLRFGKTFSYSIIADHDLDEEDIQIPALLVHPIAENAVWHGLLHKEGERKLVIHFKKAGPHTLQCIVKDNGIGMEESKKIKASRLNGIVQLSKGLQLVKDRLKMLHQQYGIQTKCTIEDMKNEQNCFSGTKVTLEFPFLYES